MKAKNSGSISFSDGSKNKVVGIGMLNIEGILKLKTLYVDGLKTNLISISQLCDDNIVVNFDKDKYLIVDKIGK
jgi:uncharacterized alkaline shock family protein YloU